MKLPLGYLYSATYAGIRQAEKDDLALIVSGLPASAAAVFTQNRVQAAPVKLSRRNLQRSTLRWRAGWVRFWSAKENSSAPASRCFA